MKKSSPLYAFFDPASGGWSASRFCLWIMNIVAMIAAFWMLYQGKDPTTLIWRVVAADASVYLGNSALNAWRGKAKPAPEGE